VRHNAYFRLTESQDDTRPERVGSFVRGRRLPGRRTARDPPRPGEGDDADRSEALADADGITMTGGDDPDDREDKDDGDGADPATGSDPRPGEGSSDDDPFPVDRDRLRRALTYALALAVVLSAAGVLYVAVTADRTSDRFTEFYVLGPTGNASDYPTNLTTGETGEFVVGIENREQRRQEYTVVLVLNGTRIDARSVAVADGATWETPFSVTPTRPGSHELRILLYRGGSADVSRDPYRLLRLYISVSDPRGNRSGSVAAG
jgi:hypothetical protein